MGWILTRYVIDGTSSHSTKLASEQVAGYPAQAGIQSFFQHAVGFVFAVQRNGFINWIPACAGMTAS
ncbi:hypothetical protein [Sideroxyarcus emersonii]|uniref:hypothetical protein n=1 Tax=Sideroxyarcus emersonii TaxID=2764705 RepID=UPI001F465C17|nr:hypothetical protein [Sideroxyarcus emersonii]